MFATDADAFCMPVPSPPRTNRSFTSNVARGSQQLTFKVSNMGMRTKADVQAGATVCMQLVEPCDSLPSFCVNGVCQYSVFDTAESCCPVGAFQASAAA